MIVVIANSIPPAVRVRLKLWAVEAKPNVFVSGVNDMVANRVVDFLFHFCRDSGMIVFQSTNTPPWYKIRTMGLVKKNLKSISGLRLLFESNQQLKKDEGPF